METKSAMRKGIKKTLAALDLEAMERDTAHITAHVLELPKIQQAKSVFVYLNTDNEVVTLGLIHEFWRRQLVVCVPKIVGDQMVAVRYGPTTETLVNTRGIAEPIIVDIFQQAIDCVLVPGMAYTKDGDRLGRGGGYYDKWLSSPAGSNCFRIGICYECQLVDELTREDHDQRMDCIVTEGGIYYRR